MISKYAKYEFNGVKFECNYSEEVKPCKMVKITIDDKTAEISNSDLFALMVMYANEEQMADCIVRKPFKTIKKMIKVKARKDFKAGDDIVFPIDYEVSPEVADEYYRIKEEKQIAESKANELMNNVFKK